MGTVTRLRRLWVGAAMSIAVLLGACPAIVAADDRIEHIDEHVGFVDQANWFSGLQELKSYENTQYLAYWDKEGVLTLTTRVGLEDNRSVGIRRFTSEVMPNVNDTTNPVAYAESYDGYSHLSYRERDGAHRYLQSPPGGSFTAARYQVDRTAESTMSHPSYFEDGQNDLFFTYRTGTDANGTQELNVYNERGRWGYMGTILSGTNGGRYTFDADGAGPLRLVTTSVRGPLIDAFRFDRNERLHVTWVWDEETATVDDAKHGIYYAYSDDWGRTWYSTNDTYLGTARSDPITIDDTAALVSSDTPGFFMGPGAMQLDSHNNPHLVKPESAIQTGDRLLTDQRQAHWWRATDGRWHALWIEASGTNRATAGSLIIDDDDGLHYLYATDAFGWTAWNADPLVQADLPVRNVNWSGGQYMEVKVASSATCLDSTDYIGEPIGTTGTETAVVIVRMRNDTSARDFRINWTTDESRTWSVSKEQLFSNALVTRDRLYSEYAFTMSDSDWRGTLRQLEICPVEGASEGRLLIDSIRLRRRGTIIDVYEWNFDHGRELITAEASATNEWESWTTDTMAGNVGWGQAAWPIDQHYYDRTNYLVSFAGAGPGGWIISYDMNLHLEGGPPRKDWRFDTGASGWATAGEDILLFQWLSERGNSNEGLFGYATAANPRIYSPNALGIRTARSERDTIHITMANYSAATRARIYYITDSDQTFNEEKSIPFSIVARSEIERYTVRPNSSRWEGETIRKIRLDPNEGEAAGEFFVDRVWF